MNPVHRITELVLETSQSKPLEERPQILRDLAQLVPDQTNAEELIALAAELEAVAAKSRTMQLRLRLRSMEKSA